jgi:spore germination cell wall hydrolase CwlJ-like protein
MQDGAAHGRGKRRRPYWLVAALTVLAGWVGASSSAGAVTVDREVACLARAIYFEARGEPQAGKLAVGHVVMNRTRTPQFPSSVCGVVYQRAAGGCQFSFSCDGHSDWPRDRTAWAHSVALATAIYSGRTVDPTHGALWFHTVSVRVAWGSEVKRVARIGQHVFYAPRELPRSQQAELH